MPVFAITKDGIPCSFLMMDTEQKTTAYDILHFVHGLTEKLLAEKAALEASSIAMGKTNNHGIGGVGSVGINADDELLSVRTKTGWKYKKFEEIGNHLIHVYANNAKQAEVLAKEPSKRQQLTASLNLFDLDLVSNRDAAQIMWPKTVFTRQEMLNKAKKILVDAYSQLQQPSLLRDS